MPETSARATGLSRYRVLDLTDEKGYLCGKILGDLGADIIKVEPPGGDPGRFTAPFARDEAHPEKSLLWRAFNTSKRSIELDITGEGGREQFLELAKKSDIVVESFVPGYLQSLRLGYEALGAVNPAVILVSISGFGQAGPYAQYKAPDIVIQAMAGYMNLVGQMDRPPLRISVPQAYLHAGNDAAVGTLLALYHRERTGVGQWVDVSAQECIAWETFSNHLYFSFQKVIATRADAGNASLTPGQTPLPVIFPCKDGYVLYTPTAGQQGYHTRAMLNWLKSEGIYDPVLDEYDWELNRRPAVLQMTKEEREQLRLDMLERRHRFVSLLMHKTKRELFERALKDGFMLAPVNCMHDLLNDAHFRARSFWQAVAYPGTGEKLLHPGAPFCMEHGQYRLRRRAPHIGEHNDAILGKNLRRLNKPSLPETNGDEIFKRLKVIDLTWVTVGPRAVRYLADHGATVVKIESPARPDIGRLVPPYKDEMPQADRSGWFALYNVNRYGTSIDLTKPQGVALARRLIKWADVLIESYRPGVMKRLGLDYDTVKELNPRLIYASTSQLGQTGPYQSFGGYGHHAAAMTGFDEVTGWPDRVPDGVFWAYTDHIAPQFLITAITTALLERRRTGKGQYIDQSQNESALQFLTVPLLDYQVNNRLTSRNGNRDLNAAPHGVYRCKGSDRWCVLAVFTDEEWHAFCRVTGQSVLAEDSRFAVLPARQANEDELDRIVEAWTVAQTAEEVMHRLQAAGVAAGVVQNAADIDRDPQFVLRKHYLTFDHPVMGMHDVDALPPRFSRTPARQYLPDPCFAEHNAYVSTEILGLSDEEFVALLEAGIFGTTPA